MSTKSSIPFPPGPVERYLLGYGMSLVSSSMHRLNHRATRPSSGCWTSLSSSFLGSRCWLWLPNTVSGRLGVVLTVVEGLREILSDPVVHVLQAGHPPLATPLGVVTEHHRKTEDDQAGTDYREQRAHGTRLGESRSGRRADFHRLVRRRVRAWGSGLRRRRCRRRVALLLALGRHGHDVLCHLVRVVNCIDEEQRDLLGFALGDRHVLRLLSTTSRQVVVVHRTVGYLDLCVNRNLIVRGCDDRHRVGVGLAVGTSRLPVDHRRWRRRQAALVLGDGDTCPSRHIKLLVCIHVDPPTIDGRGTGDVVVRERGDNRSAFGDGRSRVAVRVAPHETVVVRDLEHRSVRIPGLSRVGRNDLVDGFAASAGNRLDVDVPRRGGTGSDAKGDGNGSHDGGQLVPEFHC